MLPVEGDVAHRMRLRLDGRLRRPVELARGVRQVSRGNALITELLRLSDFVPPVFRQAHGKGVSAHGTVPVPAGDVLR